MNSLRFNPFCSNISSHLFTTSIIPQWIVISRMNESVVKSWPVIYPRSWSSLSDGLITEFPAHHPAYSAYTTVIQTVFPNYVKQAFSHHQCLISSQLVPTRLTVSWSNQIILSLQSLYILYCLLTTSIQPIFHKNITKVFPHPLGDICHAHFNWY